MKTRRIALAAGLAVAASVAALVSPAAAADDGFVYRLTSGTVNCEVGSMGLGSPSSVDVDYRLVPR
jgi:hypothetical protein